MAGDTDVTGGVGGSSLEACLTLAVPLWIGRLRALPAEQLAAEAAKAGALLPGSAVPLAAGGTAQEVAAAASRLALALAIAALAPGGTVFAGLHWCTDPHAGCPGQGTRPGPA